MNMTEFTAPKSSQLNADDLVGGPRTVTITGVSGTGNTDQPVAIYFGGDGGRPYLPCKSMRRVLVAAWGADASQYVGRAMTLYRDPKVVFGGMEVGGIRISHMTHIQREMVMALTVTKAKRAPYTVKPLKVEPPQQKGDPAEAAAAALLDRIAEVESLADLEKLTAGERVIERRAKLAETRPDLAQKVTDAIAARLSELDDFPGDATPSQAA